MEQIENTLVSIRADRRITQKELANAVGISVRTIISIEKGHTPNLLLAMRIADYFSIPIEDIFHYKSK